MCLINYYFKFSGLSTTCGTPSSRGFNETEIRTLVIASQLCLTLYRTAPSPCFHFLQVSMHNKLRAAVARGDERRGSGSGGGGGGQPEAANMMMLQWDEELAMVAQRWADQCTFGHDQVSE